MNTKKAHSEHVLPLKLYLSVALALIILTALTVSISFVHLGGWNAVVAVTIATIKALLVAFIFMHLRYEKKINLFIFTMGLVFIGLFISLTMFDTLRRTDIYEIEAQPVHEKAVIYKKQPPDSTKTHH